MIKKLHPGMGQAVAERTILRKKNNGELETWGDVATRVALGNSLLCKTEIEQQEEFKHLSKYIKNGSILMSGRHLQHGDKDQESRNLEVFSNCSSSATSFFEFYLLLNGSGVGRCVDDDLMVVNWDNAPTIRCVLDEQHPDFDWSAHESTRDARHKYGTGKDILWHKVADSREGWAKALELWENAAFEKIHSNKMLILDFSLVRCKGSPIGGMQDRPASGPVPLMNAFMKAGTIKGGNLSPWLQTMYIDHYFAECVLVGGARRAARMVVKYWKDPGIIEFCGIKRPIEFYGKNADEVKEMRDEKTYDSFLWSSNNSVLVDKEFWDLVELKRSDEKYSSDPAKHARKVFKIVTEYSYGDGTGEPGFINIDKLVSNNDGLEKVTSEQFGSKKYKINEDTELFMSKILKKCKKKKYRMLTNPCSEITFDISGAFCIIGDIVPFHANTLDEAEEAFRVSTRALMRVNTMDSIYKKEVERTNRIGIGMTGIHEFAWKFFKMGFRDLIDEEKSKDFWMTLARFNRAVRDESIKYARKYGMNIPHTCTTIKPSGTTSKLFGLTEGWHLPSMAWYMRWVQFRDDDPLLKTYARAGYKIRTLKKYPNTVIVGFPTEPLISSLGIGTNMVISSEATMEEQYKWLMLGEKYWIKGVNEDGSLVEEDYGNQISYTLKYSPDVVSLKDFKTALLQYQKEIKCCSVMPQSDVVSYEYQPEESITKGEYEQRLLEISNSLKEDIGIEHVDCSTGGCPVDFKEA